VDGKNRSDNCKTASDTADSLNGKTIYAPTLTDKSVTPQNYCQRHIN